MKNYRSKNHLVNVTPQDKHLTDVHALTPIPTNMIIDKTLTGFGATYSEIVANRNSIIVMPNIAIIANKHERHHLLHNTLAVWGKVKDVEVLEYIRSTAFPKKFLVTPESFRRVYELLESSGVNPAKEYFLLIDEAHKATKDAGYRERISEPFKWFFQFDGKALITATPLPLSHPGFSEFRNFKIDPSYVYAKPINVISTHNILDSLKSLFEANPNIMHFIFFNSIQGIKEVIKKLQIETDSSIFCSEDGGSELIVASYERVHSKLAGFSKYNFLTSSFYNGLDILMNQQVNVVILTEIRRKHTAIDPFTDVTQILGRFRNNNIQNAIHLYTTNGLMHVLEPNKSEIEIETMFRIFEAIGGLRIANPDNEHDRNVNAFYSQIVRRLGFYNFTTDGQIDFFKIDNYTNEQRVLGYYKLPGSLQMAYRKNKEAIQATFNTHGLIRNHNDALNLRPSSKRYSKENVREIVKYLQAWRNQVPTPEHKDMLLFLQRHYNEIVQAFNTIGYDEIVRLDYKIKAIKRAVIRANYESKRNSYPIVDELHLAFQCNRFYASSHIAPKMQSIYDEWGMKVKVKATLITAYFEAINCSKKINGKSVRGYMLKAAKYNHYKDYTTQVTFLD